MGRSIRTDRWRYTEWANAKEESVGVELYDEQSDPHENQNVADAPENAVRVAELARQLHAGWRGAALASVSAGGDLVIGNFEERTLGGWKTEGEAFQRQPARDR